MINLIKYDIFANLKNLIFATLATIISSLIIKSEIINIIISFYLLIGIILDIETNYMKDKSIFYLNVFPKKRGYIIIQKLVLFIIITIYFYFLVNCINYILSVKLVSPMILVYIMNIILISTIFSISTKVHLISIYTNIVVIFYAILYYLLMNYLGLNELVLSLIAVFLGILLFLFLRMIINITDYI